LNSKITIEECNKSWRTWINYWKIEFNGKKFNYIKKLHRPTRDEHEQHLRVWVSLIQAKKREEKGVIVRDLWNARWEYGRWSEMWCGEIKWFCLSNVELCLINFSFFFFFLISAITPNYQLQIKLKLIK